MFTLIKNCDVYSPEKCGKKDILIVGNKIAKIDNNIQLPDDFSVEEINAENLIAVPGFIDSHVHITGGGGEGGFHTRTPEIVLSDIIKGGITTIIGCLGTDGFTRTMTNLIAKARGLEEEGISTFVYTGSYQIPVRTITGKIEDDIVLIDKIIGVGEVAISDHRSSHPSANELRHVVSAARLGGILSGKAGIVNIHMGDSRNTVELIEEVLASSEIPITQFLPTHMNRNPYLYEKAKKYALRGGFIDFTTSTIPLFLEEGEMKCSKALKDCTAHQIPIEQITFSSDGQGSLPVFNSKGEYIGLEIGNVSSLFKEVRDAILQEDIPIEKAIKVITSNPASILKLKGKGKLIVGYDADVVLLEKATLKIHSLWANGNKMMENKRLFKKGTFE